MDAGLASHIPVVRASPRAMRVQIRSRRICRHPCRNNGGFKSGLKQLANQVVISLWVISNIFDSSGFGLYFLNVRFLHVFLALPQRQAK